MSVPAKSAPLHRLADVPLFAGLSVQALDELARESRLRRYAAGQVLCDPNDPTAVLRRSRDYFLKPEREYEITGQIGNVCFLEGLVHFKRRWLLYYGTADSKIAVASAPAADS